MRHWALNATFTPLEIAVPRYYPTILVGIEFLMKKHSLFSSPFAPSRQNGSKFDDAISFNAISDYLECLL